MAETPSTMLPLGSTLPHVRLPDAVTGRIVDCSELARGKKGLLIAFICNHCPFVKHIRKELVRLAHAAIERGFAVVAINSNDEESYPQDGPAAMRQLAQEENWHFPFLFDATQEFARSLHAACTPDFFLFDETLHLSYRGQFDESRPSNGKPVTGSSLAAALDALASDQSPAADQRPSIGCSIKWKTTDRRSR